MDLMRVSYRLAVGPGESQARAERLALEQSVEAPRRVVRDRQVEERALGRVEAVTQLSETSALARIAFPLAATACDPAQLLNLLFGNGSLQPDVECVDAEFPEALQQALGGPRFGIAGLRERLGVADRALTCTAAKPMGLAPDALAELVHSFALAGLDVVKDDHGLADHDFCPFEARVTACLQAVTRAADASGRRCLYVPNLIGTPERIWRQLDFAQERGARAVMVSPMLIGLPTFWELCGQRASVPVFAHPSFAGVRRLGAELLHGTLLRLYGADAVIFVGWAGRFGTSREVCADLSARLRGDWGALRPALPVPGGGIEVENAADQVAFYGRDCMLLCGGDLQLDAESPGRRARAFVAAVAEASLATSA